jgi:hypothetical protein
VAWRDADDDGFNLKLDYPDDLTIATKVDALRGEDASCNPAMTPTDRTRAVPRKCFWGFCAEAPLESIAP